MAIGLAIAGALCCAPCKAICLGYNCFSCCCTKSMGPGGVKAYQAKIFYVMILGVGTLFGFLFGEIGRRSAEEDGGFLEELLCRDIGEGSICDGQGAILRASIASVLFFSIMLIGTIPVPTWKGEDNWRPLLGEAFHRGFWGAKIGVYIVILIVLFFIPINENAYIQVARVVSALFLVVQVMVLVNFAYDWDEAWVERSDLENDFADGSKCWLISLISLAVLAYIAAFGGMIAILVLYSGCNATIGITAYNFVICIIFVGLTLTKEFFIEEEVMGSIAPPAVVALYIAFLSFSASQSNPDLSDACDPFGARLGQNGLEIFLAISISTLSLIWISITVSGNASAFLSGNAEEREPVGGAYEIEEGDGTTRYAADEAAGDGDDEDSGNDQLWFFHLVMITASFYMAMILTNWGVSEEEVIAQGEQIGLVSMYAKAVASFVCGLLFIWTIVAPAILPERDF